MQATLKAGRTGTYPSRTPVAVLLAALGAWLAVGVAANCRAAGLRDGPAVLVMVRDPGCPYCARWDEEVSRSYRMSEEGRFAPLVQRTRGDPRFLI
jgi:protein-disulfide isomerase